MDLSENNQSESRLRPLMAEYEPISEGSVSVRLISHCRRRARHRLSANGMLMSAVLVLSSALLFSAIAQVNSNQLPSQLFNEPAPVSQQTIGRSVSSNGLKRSLTKGEEAFVMVSRGESAGRSVSSGSEEESEEAPEVATEMAPTATAVDGTTLEEVATATMAPALAATATTGAQQYASDAITTGVTESQPAQATDTEMPLSAGSATSQTVETNGSQAEAAAEDRISIDENRKHFVTHDQLTSAQHLTAQTKDEHIDLQTSASQSVPVASGGQRTPTSRAGLSKVSHVSSFLSGK